jgi:hypothetical protein
MTQYATIVQALVLMLTDIAHNYRTACVQYNLKRSVGRRIQVRTWAPLAGTEPLEEPPGALHTTLPLPPAAASSEKGSVSLSKLSSYSRKYSCVIV